MIGGRDGEPRELAERRETAWETYRATPMPTRGTEEWRYTDPGELDPESFTPLAPDAPRSITLEELPAVVRDALASDSQRSGVAVQLDGGFAYRSIDPELEERGVVFAPIREVASTHPDLIAEHLFASAVSDSEKKLWTLHIAMLSDGYVLHVPRGVALPHPVHVFHHVERAGALVSTHSLILAGADADVTVIDEYVSPDLEEPTLSLAGIEIFGSAGSTVRYLSLQRFGSGVRHFAMQHATTQRDTKLSGCNVSLGADLARTDVTSHLEGSGSDSEMLALWFGDEHQHFDHHTVQHHAAPSARSDLLYKGALTGSARSVFRGLIRVDPGAQLTDAYQTNRNLLLSKESTATTLPNLEIEADDVRCSHGATVGQVDETQLFYLMSRGLSRHQAERLLVFGFFHEVLERIPVVGVRERIRESIEEKIGI